MSEESKMISEKTEANIEALFRDERLAERLFSCKTPEETLDFLKENGVEMTAGQLKSAARIIDLRLSNQISDGDIAALRRNELTENLLGQIDGGTWSGWLASALGGAAQGFIATAFLNSCLTVGTAANLVATVAGFAAGTVSYLLKANRERLCAFTKSISGGTAD